jgi:hypothetical protein
MPGIDRVLNASVDAVAKSGLLEGNALMATVSVVNLDGTLTVTRADDTYESVRVLSGYLKPTVGDTVELLRSAGGWVCVGKLMTTSTPRIQAGTVVTPTWSGATMEWTEATVTFPKVFANTPVVVATLFSGLTSTTIEIDYSVNALTTTGFVMRSRRSTSSATTFTWLAVDF